MFKNLKKVELHLHLDGSMRVSTAEELFNEKDLGKKMIADNKTRSLAEYLTKFDLPIKILQKKENLIRICMELIEDLDKDNVVYAEIRFAPNFHTKEGLSLDEVVESVLSGLRSNKVKTNLILCMMRGDSFENNKKIIDLAIKYKNKGVCCIDLAGDEAKYPTYLYEELFTYAKENKIDFIIHAGEASSSHEIMDAIKYGAKRIGHGIKAIDDQEVINSLINNKIPLEVCPTSNVETKAVKDYMNHPIKKLKEKNLLITINTDNRTVSNISLSKEYELLHKYFNFDYNDFIQFNRNSLEFSFATKEEKEEILKKIT